MKENYIVRERAWRADNRWLESVEFNNNVNRAVNEGYISRENADRHLNYKFNYVKGMLNLEDKLEAIAKKTADPDKTYQRFMAQFNYNRREVFLKADKKMHKNVDKYAIDAAHGLAEPSRFNEYKMEQYMELVYKLEVSDVEFMLTLIEDNK